MLSNYRLLHSDVAQSASGVFSLSWAFSRKDLWCVHSASFWHFMGGSMQKPMETVHRATARWTQRTNTGPGHVFFLALRAMHLMMIGVSIDPPAPPPPPSPSLSPKATSATGTFSPRFLVGGCCSHRDPCSSGICEAVGDVVWCPQRAPVVSSPCFSSGHSTERSHHYAMYKTTLLTCIAAPS